MLAATILALWSLSLIGACFALIWRMARDDARYWREQYARLSRDFDALLRSTLNDAA